jgi:hypothetical protein
MKKYVWSETLVEGGHPFTGKLASPPTNTGAFQNLADQRRHPSDAPPAQFYADSAVIAYRLPATDVEALTLKPKVTS